MQEHHPPSYSSLHRSVSPLTILRSLHPLTPLFLCAITTLSPSGTPGTKLLTEPGREPNPPRFSTRSGIRSNTARTMDSCPLLSDYGRLLFILVRDVSRLYYKNSSSSMHCHSFDEIYVGSPGKRPIRTIYGSGSLNLENSGYGRFR
jgi:hypothetical protein